ncbi:MAG TPA: hypothetical protein VM600_04810, partial [Actinomycetota bacterium]|nr:hypothetical protein [Actinomycetota bacterium]
MSIKRSIICAAALGALLGIVPRAAAAPTAGAEAELEIGTGEKLLLVVAGEYLTQWDAESANSTMSLGDM